jgi:ribonuclease P protein component
MVLFAIRTEGDGRFGVTASRKVGNAVVRARTKRRLRELYRHRRPSSVVARMELVANARRSCASAPWCALERDFDRCLDRLGERMKTSGP